MTEFSCVCPPNVYHTPKKIIEKQWFKFNRRTKIHTKIVPWPSVRGGILEKSGSFLWLRVRLSLRWFLLVGVDYEHVEGEECSYQEPKDRREWRRNHQAEAVASS